MDIGFYILFASLELAVIGGLVIIYCSFKSDGVLKDLERERDSNRLMKRKLDYLTKWIENGLRGLDYSIIEAMFSYLNDDNLSFDKFVEKMNGWSKYSKKQGSREWTLHYTVDLAMALYKGKIDSYDASSMLRKIEEGIQKMKKSESE